MPVFIYVSSDSSDVEECLWWDECLCCEEEECL